MRRKETIRLSRLSTGYWGKHHTVWVATDIEASLYGGELTCLLGANGAGKSTLLRTLSASQPPVSGEIWIGEKRLAEYADKELAKLVGIVLTERCDVENLTVEELVEMGRTPYTGFWGTLRKEDKQIVSEAMRQVGITKLSGRMVQTLSDGERQKVMIAKALAQQTPIILLDEPTAFLDFSSKVEVMRLLRSLAHDLGKTVFLSTHDLELALQIADKLWLMNAQGIVTGTPEDLSLSGTLERFFCHEGIAFDSHTGLFRMAFMCIPSGSSVRATVTIWCRKPCGGVESVPDMMWTHYLISMQESRRQTSLSGIRKQEKRFRSRPSAICSIISYRFLRCNRIKTHGLFCKHVGAYRIRPDTPTYPRGCFRAYAIRPYQKRNSYSEAVLNFSKKFFLA